MTFHFKSTLLAAAVLASLAAPIAAVAATTVEEVTVTANTPAGTTARHKVVKVADLDMGKPEGVETLLGRLRNAAEEVCTLAAPRTPQDLEKVGTYQHCLHVAMDGAVAQVGNPDLDHLYALVR